MTLYLGGLQTVGVQRTAQFRCLDCHGTQEAGSEGPHRHLEAWGQVPDPAVPWGQDPVTCKQVMLTGSADEDAAIKLGT
jgi:hypothetical protein